MTAPAPKDGATFEEFIRTAVSFDKTMAWLHVDDDGAVVIEASGRRFRVDGDTVTRLGSDEK